MVGAAVAALICQRIKLPPLLGYIAAGFVLGPHLGLWHSLVSIENAQGLSELGVIFLMFYIGLEFDLERLKKVFTPAFAALVLQTLFMLFVGMQASLWLGLSTMNGWFLGGLLSISSSMVSIKLIREKGEIHRPHAQTTVGILVLEDILAILLLSMLNGMAQKGALDVEAISRSFLIVGMFIVVVFLVGKMSSPRLIKALEANGTTETITLVTLGLIFAVSLFGERFQFSWALGGFLAGAILSGSRLAKRIENLTEPLRDMFSALFFVSVGMLIEPMGMVKHAPAILTLSAIVVVGKFTSCWLGIFLAGRPAHEAGRSSLVKSQIGEFSFVIVSVGAKYGVISPDLYAIASGIAFVTILLTPALIKNEQRILGTIERMAPSHAKEFCELYSRWQETVQLSLNRSVLLRLARKPVIRIGIHFLLINGIIIGAAAISSIVEPPEALPVSKSVFQQCVFILSLLVSMPLLVDTMRNLNVLVLLFSDTAFSSPTFKQFSSGPYRSVFNILMLLVLLFVYGTVFLVVAAPFFPSGTIFLAFLLTTGLVGWIFWKRLVRMHHNLEMTFLQSMNQEAERRISEKISANLDKLKTRRPWLIKVEPVVLHPDSRWAGKTIGELDLRKESGTQIAGIERSGFELTEIGPNTRLYPNDHIFLLGESNQIATATEILEARVSSAERDSHAFPFHFDRTIVPPFCKWTGMPIIETGIKKDYHVTIVGIQREDERIIGPSPYENVLEGDMLLIMGCEEDVERFKSEMSIHAKTENS